MKLAIFVHGRPHADPGAARALAFAEAAVSGGHALAAVVFYHEATLVLADDACRVTGEGEQRNAWRALSRRENVPLLVCAAGAARRGLNCEPIRTLSAGEFLPAGLGTILDAVQRSDRTVTFSA